jgi:hypothetical protein
MNNKRNVLFVTQTLGYKAACGIGLIGKLISDALCQHPDYNIESNADFRRFKKQFRNALLEMY